METSKKIELHPESTALVIVDMQVEGCERHGPNVKPVIANIRRLLDRFRAINGKIIHVQSVRTKDHPEFTVFGRPYGLLLGSPGADFVEELKPLPGEDVVQKTDGGDFGETGPPVLPRQDRCDRNRIEQLRLSCSNRISHQKLLQHRAGRLHSRHSPSVPTFCPASVPFQCVQFQRDGVPLRRSAIDLGLRCSGPSR